MHLSDTLLTFLRGLMANKLRAALTMLGIIIGVNDGANAKFAASAPTAPNSSSTPDAKNLIIYRSVKAAGSPFGFNLSAEADSGDARSTQFVRQKVIDAKTGNVVGTVELSEGPAYGRSVLTSVAWGAALASLVALLLAAAVGWFVSRRISAPILALADVTARMAAGDLSSRAAITSQDEFGHLAHSFNQMAGQVETTVLALRRFVSDAAHELHTPLTALRTNLDLAADEPDVQAHREYGQRAQAMVRRLEGLTNELLDLSRIQATTERCRTLNLRELVETRIEVYASQAEQAGLALQMNLPAEAVYICGDASHTMRAVDNLVDNACKFTPSGGTVTVSLDRKDGRVDLHLGYRYWHPGRGPGAVISAIPPRAERDGVPGEWSGASHCANHRRATRRTGDRSEQRRRRPLYVELASGRFVEHVSIASVNWCSRDLRDGN